MACKTCGQKNKIEKPKQKTNKKTVKEQIKDIREQRTKPCEFCD